MIPLLRKHLAPYKSFGPVLVLQAVQATASLLLPSLNADIIDKGVIQGDTAYIWKIGALMLAVTAVQAIFSVARCTAPRSSRWASDATCALRCSTASSRSPPEKSTSSARRR